MAAGCEVETHEGIAGLQEPEEHRLIHLAAGVRLHIGELAAEQLLGALDRQRLGDIDEFAAAIIALAGIAFGVLVGHHRALRLEDGAADDVLRCDQFDLMLLTTELAGYHIRPRWPSGCGADLLFMQDMVEMGWSPGFSPEGRMTRQLPSPLRGG